MFSKGSQKLRNRKAVTLPQLVNIFQSSYTPTPTVETLNWLFDIKSEIGKFAEELVGHSKPHVFKLELGTEGAVHLTYKHWAKDNEWRPKNEITSLVEPIEILHGNLPEKLSPTLVTPNFEKNEIDGLKSFLQSSRARMSQEEQTWWQLFIGKQERGRRFWASRAEKLIKQTCKDYWFLRHLGTYIEATETEEDEDFLQTEREVVTLLEKSQAFPKVCREILITLNQDRRQVFAPTSSVRF